VPAQRGSIAVRAINGGNSMKWMIGFVSAVVLAATSAAIAAEESGYGMPLVKIAVKDYQRAIDFYTKLGMKQGQKYNPAEQEIKWDNVSQGSNIVLVHDENGQMKFTPGTAWLVIQVPDLKATAKTLKDSGYPDIGEPRDMKQYLLLMVQDPDGNHVELVAPKR
jgi:catechol 2,3-dioxygenase-like lactoylglutathione lyase family enzyme